MAGIYIHIPFCRQACSYCDFHFSTTLTGQEQIVRAIVAESVLRKGDLAGEVTSVYFGGGTPSLLSIAQLSAILAAIYKNYRISQQAELTLELNPDDADLEKLTHFRSLGINRLSIGIQSFFADDLLYMHRAHNATQSRQALENALKAGFSNITADLIYGFPQLTVQKLTYNTRQLLSYGIPHISAYSLTVEPGTALSYKIAHRTSPPVNDDQAADHFIALRHMLMAAGYQHYEISNYSKPGFHSRHNSSYWQGKPYIGLGPSASGYTGGIRYQNVPNNNKYIKAIDNGTLPQTIEVLTPDEAFNEFVLTSLRTSKGLALPEVEKRFGTSYLLHAKKVSQTPFMNALINYNHNAIVLTPRGQLLADGVMERYFI